MPSSSGNKEPDDSQTWELAERCLLPIAFSHAVAVILATILNTFGISQTSSFVLFILLLVISVGSTLFYHNLKVRYLCCTHTHIHTYISFYTTSIRACSSSNDNSDLDHLQLYGKLHISIIRSTCLFRNEPVKNLGQHKRFVLHVLTFGKLKIAPL